FLFWFSRWLHPGYAPRKLSPPGLLPARSIQPPFSPNVCAARCKANSNGPELLPGVADRLRFCVRRFLLRRQYHSVQLSCYPNVLSEPENYRNKPQPDPVNARHLSWPAPRSFHLRLSIAAPDSASV